MDASSGAILSVRGLCKSFGALTVAESIYLDLKPGDRVGLIGPNGAGKTTFVNLLTGVVKPDAGEIILDGVSIESSPNGTSWSAVSGLTVTESPSKTWTADFNDTTARYFRAVLTASGSNNRVSVEEFESYNTATGSVTLGAGDFTTTW